jgi:hypothetical protein
MKIHSNYLSPAQLEACLADVKHAGRVVKPVTLYLAPAASRSRSAAWEARLYWLGTKRPGDGRRRPRSRVAAISADAWAAFDDEWGWWLARVFQFDPDAITGPYRGAADFHAKTRSRFGSGGAGSDGDGERHASLYAAERAERLAAERAERLAAEHAELDWWAGQAKRARSRSAVSS